MFDLNGKTALVTGASGGIGGAIARALARQGARVALSGTRVEALEKLRGELGGDHPVAPCNLSDPAAVDALVGVLSEARDAQLQLDILRGMTDALKGKRDVAMPSGWERVEERLGKSDDQQVRLLTQSLGLTFGSKGALEQLRAVALDRSADANARRAALESLLTSRDAELLLAAGGAQAAGDADRLASVIGSWLRDGDLRRQAGAAARGVVERGLGAAERSAALVERLLGLR